MKNKTFEIFTVDWINEAINNCQNQNLIIDPVKFAYLVNEYINHGGKYVTSTDCNYEDVCDWFENAQHDPSDRREALVIGAREFNKRCDHKFPQELDFKDAPNEGNLKNYIDGLVTASTGICVRCNEKIGKE